MSASHAQHLSAVAREVEDFVSTGGWDQPPQLFALVPTVELVQAQPDLAAQVDAGALLTPVAQDALPGEDLADALAGIMWPEAVQGCAIAKEIVVLPPEAEDTLPAG
ncbi:MAG: PPA1309 family protein, partial [Actinomycetes bacterium]